MAARHLRRLDRRRGRVDRGHHVRRLLHRRLEGDQRVRHDPAARSRDGHARPLLRRLHPVDRLRRRSSPRPASPTTATRAASPKKPRPICKRPASATPPSSARKPNSSSSTTCASRPIPTTRDLSSTPPELPTNSDTAYEGGNLGHRVRTKGGYFPVPPIDSAQDMRGEMLAAMAAMGVKVEKHHHEVASAQHELGLKFETLVTVADHLQIYKYCHPSGGAFLRQDGDLHAEAGVRRQWLGHACPPVDLEGRQAGVRRRQIRRPEPGVPVVYRRHHQARQGAERFHQPVDELL